MPHALRGRVEQELNRLAQAAFLYQGILIDGGPFRHRLLSATAIISRNWRSKGLRGIRSLRNSMSVEMY